MIIYVPRLIESAEQAEALPPKAVVVNIDERTGEPWAADLREDHQAEGLVPIKGDHFVALVPIEAEEEWTAMGEDHGDPWIAHVGYDGIDGTREEAEAYVKRYGGNLAHRARTPWREQD